MEQKVTVLFCALPNSKANVSTRFGSSAFWFYWSGLFCSSPTLPFAGCFSSPQAAHSGCKFRAARMATSGILLYSPHLPGSTAQKPKKQTAAAKLYLQSIATPGFSLFHWERRDWRAPKSLWAEVEMPVAVFPTKDMVKRSWPGNSNLL